MQTYRLLNRIEYVKTLTTLAKQAKPGERILIATMTIDPSERVISELLSALEVAAKRGVDVTLIIDAINFLTQNSGVPLPAAYRQNRPRTSALWTALRQLQEAGGSFFITNIPTRRVSLPQIGRSHIKAATIGNTVFVGGCNLDAPGHIDIMVQWNDKSAATTVATWLERITESERVRDAFSDIDTDTAIDTNSRLLLDAGVPHQSLIYDEALRLIDEAEQWLFITCQYFPGGVTARHLAAAHERGVDVAIQFNHPRAHGVGAPLQYAQQLHERTRGLPEHFFTGKLGKLVPKLHAKILASEKAALVGSHNYVTQGITLGTAELALHVTNASFAETIRDFAYQQIAAATSRTASK